MSNNFDEKEILDSKSLVPPEAKLAGINSVTDQPYVSPPLGTNVPIRTSEISTPKKVDIENTPLSTGLDAIDLNIVNLESTLDVRLDERARSSPSFRDFGKDTVGEHRKTASTSKLPVKADDPEDRLGQGRQYSLDLGHQPTDHVIIEIEQERARKAKERKFKIIIGLVIFALLFTVTFFMMAWEMGYLNQSSSFSTPVFY